MLCYRVSTHNRLLNCRESFITNRFSIKTPETRSQSMISKQRKQVTLNLSDNQLSKNDQISKLTLYKKHDQRSRFSIIRPKIRVSSILSYADELGLPEIINKKKRLYCKLDREFGIEGWNETYAKYFNSPTQTLSRVQVEQVKRRKQLLLLVNQK